MTKTGDFYVRQTCRLCGSQNLKPALRLGDSPLCDAYTPHKDEQAFYPLNLLCCDDCSFAQTDVVVEPEIIYRDYIYVTESSPGLQRHFKKYADYVCDEFVFDGSEFIVDIGSNDGTLLSCFKGKGHRVLGVEPAVEIAKRTTSQGIETLPEFFGYSLAKDIVQQYGSADLVTINNLFANIDDLFEFVQGVESLLSDDGLLCIEASYLPDLIGNVVFDFIYHEHLSCFAILPLVRFFAKHNMRLVHAHKIDTKGGSMRYFWAKNGSKWSIRQSVDSLTKKEQDLGSMLNLLHEFQSTVDMEKEKMRQYLASLLTKSIVGYGASATTTTLISHFEIADFFRYLVDDNPAKIDTYSPGYRIPVRDPDTLKQNYPDVIVLFAWRFREQILNRLRSMGIHAHVVVPLPLFEVIEI